VPIDLVLVFSLPAQEQLRLGLLASRTIHDWASYWDRLEMPMMVITVVFKNKFWKTTIPG